MKRRSRTRARVKTPAPRRAHRGDPAEAGLLTVARDLAAIADAPEGSRERLARALDRLTAAFLTSAALPRALADAARRTHDSKAALLALSWAREQVRLGLAEIVQRAAREGVARTDVSPEALAWLVLAGYEALAHEPPEARADRVRALATLVARD